MPKFKRTENQAGQFYGVRFHCPGCGYSHVLHTQETHPDIKGPRWTFNGDYDKPTLSPSILSQTHTWTPPVTPENLEEWRKAPWPQTKVPYVCHSFVGINGAQPGQIIFLGDCTHALKGQVVDLPDIDAPGVDDF